MADNERIKAFNDALQRYRQVDKEKALRTDMGSRSASIELQSSLDELDRWINFATPLIDKAPNKAVTGVTSVIGAITSQMVNQGGRNDTDWINNKPSFIQEVRNHVEQLSEYTPSFVSVAILQSGLLQNQDIHVQVEAALTKIKEESEKLVDDVRLSATNAIEEAKKLAEEIETKARRTAAKISVKDAQQQFAAAQEDLDKKVKTWAKFAIVTVIVLLATVAIMVVYEPKEPSVGKWPVYDTVIRVTLIGIMATISAFCLRIYRAHIHMRELNLHRQRIANSVSSFVESALTADQRDIILTRLVEAICNFGNSGLLTENDDMSTPTKTIVETVTRNVTNPTRA